MKNKIILYIIFFQHKIVKQFTLLSFKETQENLVLT